MRAIALIDGEHYAPVVKAALEELPYDVVAAVLVGGTEKLRGDVDGYGVPLEPSVEAAIERHQPDVILDLSDEPVLGPRERFAVASRVLAAGLPYVGADFRFDPPALEPFPLPSIGIVGTGKRVGKTAITAHAAHLLARDRDVVVVAMGRGGAAGAGGRRRSRRPSRRCSSSRARGAHAASDYLETAALAGVPTIGCRRCGGGLAGVRWPSPTSPRARLAARAASPSSCHLRRQRRGDPAGRDARRILVVNGGAPDPEVATGYLNAYRILVSDLVVLTMAEPGTGWEELRRAGRALSDVPGRRDDVLRPRPIEPDRGRRVAFFSTAPESAHELFAAHLARRARRRRRPRLGRARRPRAPALRAGDTSRRRSSSSS